MSELSFVQQVEEVVACVQGKPTYATHFTHSPTLKGLALRATAKLFCPQEQKDWFNQELAKINKYSDTALEEVTRLYEQVIWNSGLGTLVDESIKALEKIGRVILLDQRQKIIDEGIQSTSA